MEFDIEHNNVAFIEKQILAFFGIALVSTLTFPL
jgi:hypothetical protein